MDRIIKNKWINGLDALNNIRGWFGCPDYPIQTDEIRWIIDRTGRDPSLDMGGDN